VGKKGGKKKKGAKRRIREVKGGVKRSK